MSFGLYFKNLRNSKHATQQRIADAIGKKTMLVSNVEHDKNGPFSNDDLEKIAMVLKLSEEEKRQLLKEAAKARGRLPLHLHNYLFDCAEAYRLLETCAENKPSIEMLSHIIQMVKECD